MLKHFISRVERKSADPSQAPVLIVAFGDSVTQGCMESGVLDLENVYHNVLKRKLELEWPKSVFSVINAGVGGESAGQGLRRIKRDLLKHDPDLVIVGFCLNDSCGGLATLPEYRKNIRAIVGTLRAESHADIILLTPNAMASHENAKIAEEHRKFAGTIIGTQNGGVLKAYAEALKEIAMEMGIPAADIYAEWEQMASDGIDTTELLVNGLNHPGADGHRLIAEKIMNLVQSFRK